MSYDIELFDPDTEGEADHINVTWNYADHLYRLLGKKGIRSIYGMTGEESIPIIMEAIKALGTDVCEDRYQPTEGNVRRALEQMVIMAKKHPSCIWDGD
jgi:hypothetical protein